MKEAPARIPLTRWLTVSPPSVHDLRGFPMASNNNDNPRESIWNIRQLSLTRYYITFAALFVLVTGVYLWRGFDTAVIDAYVVDTAMAALKEASALIPWLIIFTYYLVEGVSMLAERYLKSRYAKGREDERQAWRAWNQRREEALREGKEFTEPPPDAAAKGNN